MTVHEHSRSVAMLIVPDPPAEVMVDVLIFSFIPHRCMEEPVGFNSVVDEEPHAVPKAAIRNIER